MKTSEKRDAKRIIHSIDHALKHIPIYALDKVAKELSNKYNIPQKIMLKSMKSYVRIHLSQRTPVNFKYDAPLNVEFLGAAPARNGEDY